MNSPFARKSLTAAECLEAFERALGSARYKKFNNAGRPVELIRCACEQSGGTAYVLAVWEDSCIGVFAFDLSGRRLRQRDTFLTRSERGTATIERGGSPLENSHDPLAVVRRLGKLTAIPSEAGMHYRLPVEQMNVPDSVLIGAVSSASM